MEVVVGLLLVAVVLALIYGPSVIAILKGQLVWGILGILLFAPLGWAGALMTAKPGSWWAKRRYDDAQRAKAIAKHGDPATAASQPTPPPPGAPGPATGAAPPAPATPADPYGEAADGPGADWECGICGERSATRVAAESHVRGSHPQAPVESSISPV